MVMLFRVFVALLSIVLVHAYPTRRQAPCFITGSNPLPAEVTDAANAIAGAVTCRNNDVLNGIPDVESGGITFSSIDFRSSDLSPVGFALQTFFTPPNPADADLELLDNQLNVYLAIEAAARSTGDSIVGPLKGPKFFLQFQKARVRAARGETLSVAESVGHQLGKVIKNAVRASAGEIAQVNALAEQLG